MTDEACEGPVEGPDVWNGHFSIAGRGEDENRSRFVVRGASVAGWAVEGAGLVPKKPETTNECGYSPCNTLSVPMKAAIIARDRAESKADAPDVGWAKESVCEGADCIAAAGDRGFVTL